MESYEEDMKFLENLLGLPPVWDCLHDTAFSVSTGKGQKFDWESIKCAKDLVNSTKKMDFNETKKRYSFKEFMSQLSEFEINLLYSAYYEDFVAFGYDPCEGL